MKIGENRSKIGYQFWHCIGLRKMCQFSFLFFFLIIPLLKFDRQSLSSRVIAIFESNKWLTDYISQEMLNFTLKVTNKKGIFSFYSHDMRKKKSVRAISITVVLMLLLKVLKINKSKGRGHKDQ